MKQIALGELGQFSNGVNFTSDRMGRGIPLINVKDITNSHRIDMASLDLVEVEVDEKMLAHNGDIFFVRSSVKLDGIALAAKLKSSEEPAIHCGFVIRFRPTSQDICSDYLLYLLRSPEYRERLKNLSSGAAIVNISQSNLKALKLRLPPLTQQSRIADILSAYDDLIGNNRRRISLLEQAARLLYREWFVRLRFPGHEHVKIVDGVPEGWVTKRLDKIALVNRASLGTSHQGEIEYIDISSVTPGSIGETALHRFEDAPSRARRIVQHGDIIWSCVRPNRRSHAVIWRPAANLVASTGFAVVTPTEVPTSYLYHTLTTDEYVGYLANNARGVAYPAVTASDFEKSMILVPPHHLLEIFNQLVEPTMAQNYTLSQQARCVAQARDLLLPRLMNGEIAV